MEGTCTEGELRRALQAYGLEPDRISFYTRGCYSELYRARSGGKEYVARLRSPEALPKEVLFAADWAEAVAEEVKVPLHFRPEGSVPEIGHRCLDVAPHIPHEHTDGGRIGPDSCIRIGDWLGRLHRLGGPLAPKAPVGLDYGNHPHGRLMQRYLDQARVGASDEHLPMLKRAERLEELVRVGVRPLANGLPEGVVHGDMHFWNVLYCGDSPVAIVDLDFLQRGVLIHDLAYAYIWLNAWEDKGGVWADVGARYVAAYESGRESGLSAAEREALPFLRVWIHLFFFLGKVRVSWNRAAEAHEDLCCAEETAQRLGL